MIGTDGQLFQLEQDEELRIEVDCPKGEFVTVELKTGMAEIFGTELVPSSSGSRTEYRFASGSKFSVFTYHGCQVLLRGSMEEAPYTSRETPMISYVNVHAALEKKRQEAEESGERGPIVMVVGPTDVGKSTLCRILLNYAVRVGRRPLFVDLDVGQGELGVPGCIGAQLVERPAALMMRWPDSSGDQKASVEEGFSQNAPLVYHYGHTTPGHNPPLFNRLVSRMADVMRERLARNRKVEVSGVVINTCGWIRGEGYNQIKHIAQAFEVRMQRTGRRCRY